MQFYRASNVHDHTIFSLASDARLAKIPAKKSNANLIRLPTISRKAATQLELIGR